MRHGRSGDLREARLLPRVPATVRLIAAAIAAGAALGTLGVAAASSSTPAQFRWLVPTAAPESWKHVSPPAGGMVMWYPPSLVRIKSDSASASVAQRDRRGRIRVYLNVTPKEGNEERLGTWTTFRIQHNKGEDDRVRLIAEGDGLRFQGGKGSCVIDDYYTRVIVHHYEEIACLVQGRTSTGVIVVAALQSDWAHAAPLLERAISGFWVS